MTSSKNNHQRTFDDKFSSDESDFVDTSDFHLGVEEKWTLEEVEEAMMGDHYLGLSNDEILELGGWNFSDYAQEAQKRDYSVGF